MAELNFTKNLTGNQVAAMSWELPQPLLSKLLLETTDEKIIEDTRSQLALWGISQKRILFANFAEAWNSFVAPKAGMSTPAVLLPGTSCTRCLKARFTGKGLGRGGERNCPECKGTGRRPPRAVPAAYAKAPQPATTPSETRTPENSHKD